MGGAYFPGMGGLVLDTGRVVSITRSDNTYSGPTDVRSGSLHLESGRVSAIPVAAQAALTGTGTIAGDLLNQSSVRPATPQGLPLAVQSNFTQTGSGALVVRLASPVSYDRLAVEGAATLDGALLISTYESLPSVGHARYAFLTAQSVAGTFAAVAGVPSDTPMLHYRLVSTARDVALEIAQQSFRDAAFTPAQRALGAHLDATLGTATGGYRTILLNLNTRPAMAEVVAGLSRLVPDRYAVLSEEAFSAAAICQSALDRRLASLRQSHPADQSGGVAFFEGGARTTVETDGSRADLALTAGYGFTGGSWALTPSFGLLSSRLTVDDFIETLASGNPGTEMAVTDWSVRSLRSRVGFDLAHRSPSGALVPHLAVTWLHEFKRDRGFDARFAAAPAASAYRASGRPTETDLVQASLGLDWRITRNLGFSINAGFAQGKNTDTTSDFAAGFRWEF